MPVCRRLFAPLLRSSAPSTTALSSLDSAFDSILVSGKQPTTESLGAPATKKGVVTNPTLQPRLCFRRRRVQGFQAPRRVDVGGESVYVHFNDADDLSRTGVLLRRGCRSSTKGSHP